MLAYMRFAVAAALAALLAGSAAALPAASRVAVAAALAALPAASSAAALPPASLPAASAAALPPASLPWRFDWTTLSTFAFPGAAPRFMTAAEVAYFEANFSSMLIWGLNSTCADGSPAACADSKIYCNRSSPETQRFLPTMEASLQQQGEALKARRAAQRPGVYFPVLGYLESLSAQQYYLAHQKILYDDAAASWRLAVDALGVIDCFKDGCSWQGTEFRQFDLRQPVVRDYYVYDVMGAIVNGSGLDGTFMDVLEWWYDACGNWACSAQERDDLVSASLLALEQVLQAYPNKVFSVSSHTSLTYNTEYYLAQLALLKASGNGVRFWEFFEVSDVPSLIYETQVMQLPVHVHVTSRTLCPDWLELAAVLLGYGDYTYFSFSGPWMLDSFDVFPEFSRPLGRPLAPARSTTENTTVPAWGLLSGENLVYDWPSGPYPNASIPGKLAFLGLPQTAADCLALVRANASFTAMTFVDSADPLWGHSCWGRLESDVDWQRCIDDGDGGAPCWTQAEATIVSAVAVPIAVSSTTWTRSFEHLDVTLVAASAAGGTSATLAWH